MLAPGLGFQNLNGIGFSGQEPEPPPDPTFSDYVDLYLNAKELEGLATTSLLTYERIGRTVLGGEFGDTLIKDIRKSMIQSYLAEQKKRLAIDTVKLHLSVLNGILELAVDDGVIPRNPAHKVRVGESDPPKEKGFYTADQLKTFLRYVQKYGEPYLSVVILGGIYALRRGEIVGLRWSDVDFTAQTIRIQHTVTQVDGQIIEKDKTKTTAGKRTLFMLDVTVPYFKALKQTQLAAGLKLDKVCRYPDGRIVKPSTISKYVPSLMDQAGLPVVRLHDLRATALTLLSKAEGVSIKEVADYAGHANPATTLKLYIRVGNEDRSQVSKAFNSLLTSTEKK